MYSYANNVDIIKYNVAIMHNIAYKNLYIVKEINL